MCYVLYVITMKYKTINLDEPTFMLLDRVASRLDKSKAGTVNYLLGVYEKEEKGTETKKRDDFNKEMDALRKKIVFPPGVKVNSLELADDLYLAYEDEAL
jgi:hypothetical protein